MVQLQVQKKIDGYNKFTLTEPLPELAARQVLALPLYPELTLAQQESVVENIPAFFRRACGKNFLTFSVENSWLNLKH